jgi:phenylpyruvate tautomerase PptA (4-oxalocrotonate tautomerase family)
MPMIDVYAPVGVFADQHALARSLTTTLMAVEGVPDIVMFRRYTAAFVHELSADAIANVDGASNYVRVQVLTNAGALNRDKQLAVVNKLSEVSASAAGDPPPPERIRVLLTEAPDGGWGTVGPRTHEYRPCRGGALTLAEPTSSHASAGPMATKAPKSSAPQPSSPPTPPNADA